MSVTKSQEATSSASSCSYHVFLSFRGDDTRKTFTDHLYTALDQAGFHTFKDDDGIEKGEDIMSELEKAIRESRISIIVFSKNYASSTCCLEELVMILEQRTLGCLVLPVFYDVEPSEVRNQIGSFEKAFATYEEKLQTEIDVLAKEKLKDKLGTWRDALREVSNLAGMNLQNLVDGTSSNIAPNFVGICSRIKGIQHWLESGPSNVGIVAICGMGGIGKTTTARFLYDLNSSRFDGSSFIGDVRGISQQQDGLLRLQRQFLVDVCKTRKVQLNNIHDGARRIKDAICCKKVFAVLDDVDKHDQLDALLGMGGLFFSGSKIIITTRHERLLGASKLCKVHRLENLDAKESLELFSWHAFGKSCPDNGYEEISKRVVLYCGGIPLALKVLGSSLSGSCLNVWESQMKKLNAIPNDQVLEKLRISYDSLDDHDKHLFLYLACFFIGSDKDSTITILDECEFHTVVGIQNLVDRCLISIDASNALVMHHLLQQMGREIVRQESPKEPSKRSIIWNHEDAFKILRDNTGTSEIEALQLDMCLLKEEAYGCTSFDYYRKPCYAENLGGFLKRCCSSTFSSHLKTTDLENSNLLDLKANAFAMLSKLKLLKLNHVHINGPYKKFPKGLRWLCCRRFPLKTIPGDFPLESLVGLDMQYSSLKKVWEGTKFLRLIKVLNLSHSYSLAKTPDFSQLPNLERLVLKSCTSLVEVHESIGSLVRLVILDLEDCKNLRNLPGSICMLKHLETLVISGCSINLDSLPANMGNMRSSIVFVADNIGLNQSPPTDRQLNTMHSFIWPWRLKPRESPKMSWPSLPCSLVKLSLERCGLSDDDFPRELSNLCSLKEINLMGNKFCSLPEFIKGLANLDFLNISDCPRLRKLDGVPQLRCLQCHGNGLMEELTVQISHRPTTACHLDACNHLGSLTAFKLESIENVEVEIVSKLGLSNVDVNCKANVMVWHGTEEASCPGML